MSASFSPIFDNASPQAAAISNLFEVVLVICGVILLIVTGMVGISLIRFRHRPGSAEPPSYFGNRKLEIIWTIGPILIVIWLFALTARGMRQSDPPANRQPDLIVIGHQWWWEARYPQTGVVTANEIHIPAGRKWLVRLESTDVIHDFWVPALARKIQVIPGQTNHIWLEASLPGTYDGTCAEYCGAGHTWMRFSVIAESPAAFDAWLGGQEKPPAIPATDPAQAGLKIFQTMTCINCHSLRGVSMATNAAPDLTHLASRIILGAGVLSNTETNLFRWLKNPQEFKPGCFMPDLKLTDAQAGTLTSYLETLQ
ncbi:MAG TPA: cytochrome c oxidase subunit II [Candidatus Sulfotelmatobacter sp.]|jgi:cytochrome c oxidase subunit 2|nr:cytochrome c oxidase subunit II [Candidatus Sulfotelmatobacter sp.]